MLVAAGLLTGALWVAFGMVILSMFLALFRLVRGPSLPDRVVAIDLMATLSMGVIALHTIATEQSMFLDVAIAIALMAFLGTVAFARYLVRRGQDE